MPLDAIHENCSGCGTCTLACAITNFKEVNPSRALLRIEGRFPAPGDYRIHLCDECGECADNCPEEAIRLEGEVFEVESNLCTGCLICVEICPRGVMFKQRDSEVPVKCNLCTECVQACPRGAIVLTEVPNSDAARRSA